MTNYGSHWIEISSGKKFYYLSPDPDSIELPDIAHALSLLCRFGGHCKKFDSVAEHSVLVSKLCPKELAVAGLLHDASEAYMPDIPRPIKHDIAAYMVMEDNIQEAIATRFHLPSRIFKDYYVKYADDQACATEAKVLMPNMDDWENLPAPLDGSLIKCWEPKEAERVFLEVAKDLWIY